MSESTIVEEFEEIEAGVALRRGRTEERESAGKSAAVIPLVWGEVRALVDDLPDGVFRYRRSRPDGFDFVNRRLTERTGFSEREFVRSPGILGELVHPEDLATVERMLGAAPTMGGVTIRLTPKRGGVDWVELRTRGVHNGVSAVVGLVRWVARPPAPTRIVGDLELDLTRARVLVQGAPVGLTLSEFRILALLTERAGEVVTREEMMRELWQSSYVGAAAAAEAHVSTLRRKIERDPRHPERIKTVRGSGYRFVP
jgi:hypothetical protein